MNEIFEKILTASADSGRMRWNEIVNDIITVYFEIFDGDKLYERNELWALLFEPNNDKEEKKNKLDHCLRNSKNHDFFLRVLPILLKDNFKGVEKLVKNTDIK